MLRLVVLDHPLRHQPKGNFPTLNEDEVRFENMSYSLTQTHLGVKRGPFLDARHAVIRERANLIRPVGVKLDPFQDGWLADEAGCSRGKPAQDQTHRISPPARNVNTNRGIERNNN